MEEVALPIVADSPVLLEADLIEIVRTGSPRKQVVVAGRPDISVPLADALIGEAVEPAVMRLMAMRPRRSRKPVWAGRWIGSAAATR
jgi:uncharacterized protein (DUF2336 family)